MAKQEQNQEEEKFEIDKEIRSGDPRVDEYIAQMEDYIQSFDTSHIKRLLVASDIVASQLANDMVMLATGTHRSPSTDAMGLPCSVSNLNILSDDKDDKTLERLLNIVGKIKDFKVISDMVKAMKPEEKVKAEEENKVIKLDPAKNAYEQMLEEKNKRNGKK